VLDVGSGSGTLAILAARAGAEAVRSCEKEDWAAVMAMATIGLSGVAGRVGVVYQERGCVADGGMRRPGVVVHDIIGTPARMGDGAVLHEVQRVIDSLVGGAWKGAGVDRNGEQGEREGERGGAGGIGGGVGTVPVITVPKGVRVYVQVAHSPVGGGYTQVPELVAGVNVSLWKMVTKDFGTFPAQVWCWWRWW
jgi:hypothetical protein